MREKILGMIMAGGRGTRLYPLTKFRSKAAVPFGGKYRIIDFVLSNFVNSGIYSIYVLTQFRSQSLIEHIKEGWQFGSILRDHFITVAPAQMQTDGSWYKGTADAVYQNLSLIEGPSPALVAIFGADHIYRMDLSQMVNFHYQMRADVTVAALPVPLGEAPQYGVMQVDSGWRLIGFEEKPEKPVSIPGQPDQALVSLGNYLFRSDVLREELEEDARSDTAHDFGRSIIPAILKRRRVFVYDFRQNRIPEALKGEEPSYWRDIGTIESYYDANMDLRSVDPVFNLYNRSWPIKTVSFSAPPAKFVFDDEGRRGVAINSIVSEGGIVSGGRVVNSVLGRNVFVHSYAEVRDSILMNGVDVGRWCRIRRAIVDKHVKIPPGTTIGYDLDKDRERYFVSETGLVVIPIGYRWEE